MNRTKKRGGANVTRKNNKTKNNKTRINNVTSKNNKKPSKNNKKTVGSNRTTATARAGSIVYIEYPIDNNHRNQTGNRKVGKVLECRMVNDVQTCSIFLKYNGQIVLIPKKYLKTPTPKEKRAPSYPKDPSTAKQEGAEMFRYARASTKSRF
tara:strand:+ start:2387 stop:2842 length:456 start_codon:yes stop_codon:yes gene_type:complete